MIDAFIKDVDYCLAQLLNLSQAQYKTKSSDELEILIDQAKFTNV
jgi:hypothetical protein